MVEAFLVADDLDRQHFVGLVVIRFHNLPQPASGRCCRSPFLLILVVDGGLQSQTSMYLAERSFPEDQDHLVPVRDVVVCQDQVITALVVEAVVVRQ